MTFNQVKPSLKKFIEENRDIINYAGETHDLDVILNELQFDVDIDPEASSIIAFYFIAYFAQEPLKYIDMSTQDEVADGITTIYLYEPSRSGSNSWSGTFEKLEIYNRTAIQNGAWIKKLGYPTTIEKVLLDAKAGR